jgi:hypothetical protein
LLELLLPRWLVKLLLVDVLLLGWHVVLILVLVLRFGRSDAARNRLGLWCRRGSCFGRYAAIASDRYAAPVCLDVDARRITAGQVTLDLILGPACDVAAVD